MRTDRTQGERAGRTSQTARLDLWVVLLAMSAHRAEE
jgi:hypothetical protein